MNKSILASIQDAVNSTTLTKSEKKHAIKTCISVYNLFIYTGGDFNEYKQLSDEYFKKIIDTKAKQTIANIKKALKEFNILECDGVFSKERNIALGYRFNKELLKGNYTTQQYNNISQSSDTSCLFPIFEKTLLNNLNKISIHPDVYSYINNYKFDQSRLTLNDDCLGNAPFTWTTSNKTEITYSIPTALQRARECNADLIKFGKKYYIEKVDSFVERKTIYSKLIYHKYINDIHIKDFFVSRNDTNNRLDYNLTNIKSDLIKYMTFENEPLVEIDIANAQFAIFSNTFPNQLDTHFHTHAENGTLYTIYPKQRFFKIAFDKLRSDYNDARDLFPITMSVMDNYKKQHGYKSFSIMLQQKESEIMIDGVFRLLCEMGYNVFPKHDAILVKQSEVDTIKSIIEDYFKSIDFKCLLRIK